LKAWLKQLTQFKSILMDF